MQNAKCKIKNAKCKIHLQSCIIIRPDFCILNFAF